LPPAPLPKGCGYFLMLPSWEVLEAEQLPRAANYPSGRKLFSEPRKALVDGAGVRLSSVPGTFSASLYLLASSSDICQRVVRRFPNSSVYRHFQTLSIGF
jgi:hypothetical protein